MCPHCNTNNPLIIDKDWLYRCPKCGRGTLRELVVVMPMPSAAPYEVAKVAAPRQPRLVTCPKCGIRFETLANNHLVKCPACRLKRLREKEARRRARKKSRLAASSDERAAGMLTQPTGHYTRKEGHQQL